MIEEISKVPKEIKEWILAEAENYSGSIEKSVFIHGAVFMYLFQQKKINALHVEIDLLEGEIGEKK